MVVTIPQAILDEVYRHCEGAYPEEACGILAEPERQARVTRAFPCANIQNRLHEQDPQTHPRDARVAYRIDPKELLAITRALRPDGLEFKIIFHSHADVGAYFSAEDQRQAAPRMSLSVAAYARGEGLEEAEVRRRLAAGALSGGPDQVSERVASYPELVYIVVDVTASKAKGFCGFFWDDRQRTYMAVDVDVTDQPTVEHADG